MGLSKKVIGVQAQGSNPVVERLEVSRTGGQAQIPKDVGEGGPGKERCPQSIVCPGPASAGSTLIHVRASL